MYGIGDFARFGGVSVRTLRYYEEIGLLEPAAVDPTTGFRSYEAHQLPRLHRIVSLKELGLSLEQLRPLLDGVTLEELRGMLLMKRAELEARMSEEQAVLARVANRLRYIEEEDHVAVDIVLKSLPVLRVAAIRCDEPGLDYYNMGPFVHEALQALTQGLASAGVKTIDSQFFLFYEENPDGSLIPSVAQQVDGQHLPTDSRITEVIFPAIDVVSTMYEGPANHDLIGPVYGQLARWAADHGYQIHGIGRDNFLGKGATEGTRILELQQPVLPTKDEPA